MAEKANAVVVEPMAAGLRCSRAGARSDRPETEEVASVSLTPVAPVQAGCRGSSGSIPAAPRGNLLISGTALLQPSSANHRQRISLNLPLP